MPTEHVLTTMRSPDKTPKKLKTRRRRLEIKKDNELTRRKVKNCKRPSTEQASFRRKWPASTTRSRTTWPPIERSRTRLNSRRTTQPSPN